MSKNPKGYLITSVERALQVLEVLSSKGPMSLQSLTDLLNEPKTSLYRVISTLKHHGYLIQNMDQEYEIGEKVLSLSSSFLLDNNFKKAATKPMEKLFEKHGDTINLGVLSNYEIVYIDILESNFSLRMTDSIGSRQPAHATGLGKAILSQDDEKFVIDLLNNVEIISYTKNTIVDKKTILEELRKARKQGYAFDNEEIVEGARCIAAPIFEVGGRVVGAVSISGPKHRFPLDSIKSMANDVMDTAREISKNLGYFGGK